MQITIDTTQELSPEDRALLAAFIGAPTPAAEPASATIAKKLQAAATEAKEREVVPVEEPEPQPKRAPRRKPKPEPEPVEEEPVDETDEAEDEDLIGGAPTLEDAVAKATELVGEGKGAKVKAALATVGAKRVSELKGASIAGFLDAL